MADGSSEDRNPRSMQRTEKPSLHRMFRSYGENSEMSPSREAHGARAGGRCSEAHLQSIKIRRQHIRKKRDSQAA